jgi:hypothetical protein
MHGKLPTPWWAVTPQPPPSVVVGYVGEWAGCQSHDISSQTCCDCSAYADDFKGSVKHGLSCYNFK